MNYNENTINAEEINETAMETPASPAKNTKKSSGYEVAAWGLLGLTLILCAIGYVAGSATVEVLKATGEEISALETRAALAEARVAELEKPKSFSEKLKSLVQN